MKFFQTVSDTPFWLNLLHDMPILDCSSSAANKDVI